MFAESRLVLAMLSPVFGAFLIGCFYFTSLWQPLDLGEEIAKFFIEDVLSTFVTLCAVGLIASVVGPQRIQPLIRKVGSKAAMSGSLFLLGTMLLILYYYLFS